MQIIRLYQVTLSLRGGKDNDRDALEIRVGFDFGQHLAAVFARQVQVQQDDNRCWRDRKAAFSVQESHGS